MNIVAKKTKDGLLLQATEKRNGKTVNLPRELSSKLLAIVDDHNLAEDDAKFVRQEMQRIGEHFQWQDGCCWEEEFDRIPIAAIVKFLEVVFAQDPKALEAVAALEKCLWAVEHAKSDARQLLKR